MKFEYNEIRLKRSKKGNVVTITYGHSDSESSKWFALKLIKKELDPDNIKKYCSFDLDIQEHLDGTITFPKL